MPIEPGSPWFEHSVKTYEATSGISKKDAEIILKRTIKKNNYSHYCSYFININKCGIPKFNLFDLTHMESNRLWFLE